MRRSAILSQDERGLAGGRLLQLIDERNIDFDRRGNPYAGVREQCCVVGTGKAGPHHGPDGHRIGGVLHKLNLYDVSDFLRRTPEGLDIQESAAARSSTSGANGSITASLSTRSFLRNRLIH